MKVRKASCNLDGWKRGGGDVQTWGRVDKVGATELCGSFQDVGSTGRKFIESGLFLLEKLDEIKVFTMPTGNDEGSDCSETVFTRSEVVYALVKGIRTTGLTASAFRASSRDATCACSREKLLAREPPEIRNVGVGASSDSLDEGRTFSVLPVSLRNTSETRIMVPPCVASVFASLRGDACVLACVPVHVPFKKCV